MFWKHSEVCVATEVPFQENLPPLPLRRSGVPDSLLNKTAKLQGQKDIHTRTIMACSYHQIISSNLAIRATILPISITLRAIYMKIINRQRDYPPNNSTTIKSAGVLGMTITSDVSNIVEKASKRLH